MCLEATVIFWGYLLIYYKMTVSNKKSAYTFSQTSGWFLWVIEDACFCVTLSNIVIQKFISTLSSWLEQKKLIKPLALLVKKGVLLHTFENTCEATLPHQGTN